MAATWVIPSAAYEVVTMHGRLYSRALCRTILVHSMLGIFLVEGTTGCGSGEDALDGESKTLSWAAVPDPSVLGYKAYWGTSSHKYESHVDAGANTIYTITGLRRGTTYFFAVSAYIMEMARVCVQLK